MSQLDLWQTAMPLPPRRKPAPSTPAREPAEPVQVALDLPLPEHKPGPTWEERNLPEMYFNRNDIMIAWFLMLAKTDQWAPGSYAAQSWDRFCRLRDRMGWEPPELIANYGWTIDFRFSNASRIRTKHYRAGTFFDSVADEDDLPHDWLPKGDQ